MMQYDLSLTLESTFPGSTDHARNTVRVLPLTLPNRQSLTTGMVQVSPAPDERLDRMDFFGNAVTEIAFRQPLTELRVVLRARVSCEAPPPARDVSPGLMGLTAELSECRDLAPGSPLHYLADSPRVAFHPDFDRFARETLQKGQTVLQILQDLGQRLHRDMRFDAEATDVDTPPLEAFENRHGVCQDFSHIMIACLRCLGIPAGYVSGFLRTLPPEGQERLEGADAMHAWIRAWCGAELGWVEYDPTNDLMVSTDHIVVGYGRDYGDVAPLKGVLRTSGGQTGTHRVDVIPVET